MKLQVEPSINICNNISQKKKNNSIRVITWVTNCILCSLGTLCKKICSYQAQWNYQNYAYHDHVHYSIKMINRRFIIQGSLIENNPSGCSICKHRCILLLLLPPPVIYHLDPQRALQQPARGDGRWPWTFTLDHIIWPG